MRERHKAIAGCSNLLRFELVMREKELGAPISIPRTMHFKQASRQPELDEQIVSEQKE
jgi:hypothetical protein